MIKQFLTDCMVKCMLNPNNKEFYIKNLNKDNIEKLFLKMNNIEFEEIFSKAFDIANAILNTSLEDIF